MIQGQVVITGGQFTQQVSQDTRRLDKGELLSCLSRPERSWSIYRVLTCSYQNTIPENLSRGIQ